MRSYKIEVDGTVLTTLKNGESKTFEVEPGERTIIAKIDWASSAPVVTALDQDEVLHLAVGNDVDRKKFRRGFGGVWGEVVTNRDSYLKLVPVEAPETG